MKYLMEEATERRGNSDSLWPIKLAYLFGFDDAQIIKILSQISI